MSRQLELLDRAPRAKPRKLMHVCDAGSDMVKFTCHHCGYASVWLKAGKFSDDKRGRPCPNCNEDSQ